MVRIIIRTHARGPLGFVRLNDADTGVTYAAVRSAIAEQLFEVVSDEAYVFLLEDGVPVAPSQEATERVAKGMTDCFLSFSSEPRASAAGITSPQSLAAGANAGVLGTSPERSPFLPGQPPHSMVNQWIASFASMEPREQQEAISYLQQPSFPTEMGAIGAYQALGKQVASAPPPTVGEQPESSLDRQLLEMFRNQLGASTSSTGSLHPPSSPLERGFGLPGKLVADEARRRRRASDSKYYHGTLSSSLRLMEHNARTSHGSGPEVESFSTGLRNLKGHPGAHAASSPIRVGRRISSPTKSSRDRPDAPIAFGSRRPQRPSSAAHMATGNAITIGRSGSVRGIF
jgi:hypothetical protein